MTGRQIAELIDRHAAALGLYARQWCAAAEDAVQDGVCKLVALKVPPDDPAAWLFRTVRNAAIDRGKAPAGRDLGAITPEEIAMSILAEITVERRRGQRGSA